MRILPRPSITVPDFWRLWLVGLFLFLGRWVDTLAFSVYVFQKSGSALMVTLTIVMRFLPMGLFGAVAGAISERFDRRHLLIAVSTGMFATAAILLALETLGLLQTWHILAACFMGGINATFDNPCRRLMIGEVVGPAKIGTAMAIDSGTNNGSRTIGPFIAGALFAATGLTGVLIADMILFAAAIVTALTIRHRAAARRAEQPSILANIRSGLDICRRDRTLGGVLLLTVVFNLFGYPYVGLVPVVGAGSLGLSPTHVGLLASIDGVGSVLGSVLVAIFAKPVHFQRLYVASMLLGFTAIVLFALSGAPLPAGLALLLTGMAVAGFATMQNTLMFLLAPPEARGRLLGLLSVAIGVGPLGFLMIGWLADTIGPENTLIIQPLIGVLAMALIYRTWKTLLQQPRHALG